MENSAIEVSSSATFINSSSVTFEVTKIVSEQANQIADFFPTASFLYSDITPGDIIYRTFSGFWQTASAVSESEVEALAVVESVALGNAKIVYYGKIVFPLNYSVQQGVVYYVAEDMESAKFGEDGRIRNGTTVEPEFSKPMYIGNDSNTAIIVNMRGVQGAQLDEAAAQFVLVINCFANGINPEVILRNIGSTEFTGTGAMTITGSGTPLGAVVVTAIPVFGEVTFGFSPAPETGSFEVNLSGIPLALGQDAQTLFICDCPNITISASDQGGVPLFTITNNEDDAILDIPFTLSSSSPLVSGETFDLDNLQVLEITGSETSSINLLTVDVTFVDSNCGTITSSIDVGS